MTKTRWCLQKVFHDSIAEANDCNRLLADHQAGKNGGFEHWPSVPLYINGKIWKHWKIDFKVYAPDQKSFWYFESKCGWNRSDDSFRLKLSAYLLNYPEIPIYVNWELVKFSPNKRLIIKSISKQKKRAKKAKAFRKGKDPLVKTWVKGVGWRVMRASEISSARKRALNKRRGRDQK